MNTIWRKKVFVIFMAAAATALWGSAYPSVKAGYELFSIAGNDIGSKIAFAGYRFSAAGIVVLLCSKLLSGRKQDCIEKNIKKIRFSNMVKSIFVLGIIQTTIQYIFFYLGMANTTGAKGSIINASGAFFGVLLAPLFYRDERVSCRKLLGCLVGFAGIVLINIDGSSLSGFRLTGEGFVMFAALAQALASFYSKKLVKNMNVMLVTGGQLLLGGIPLILIGYASGGHLEPHLKGCFLLGYMILLSAVAFTIWTQLLKYNPVSEIAIYNLLIPVFGTILSGIFLKENIFDYVHIVSIILVCVGIMFVNTPKKGARRCVISE